MSIPEFPGTCCGTGCQNCVWLQYADDLLKYYQKSRANTKENLEKALIEIEKLQDENLKAYLLMELKQKLRDFS